MRTKHAEKSCVGLWDQSLIPEEVNTQKGLPTEGSDRWRVLTNKRLCEVPPCEVPWSGATEMSDLRDVKLG